MERIEKCPYCGSDEGVRIKYQVSGVTVLDFSFDPNITADNSDMYRGIKESRNKYAICLNCKRRVCTAEEWFTRNGEYI